MVFLYNDPRRKIVRRSLRNLQTKAKARFWRFVRNRRFHGQKVRRQYGIGPFVVDFFCPEQRLAIEIDGNSHFGLEAKAYDHQRTAFLHAHNIRVIRFTNQQVLSDIEGVLAVLNKYLP